MNNNTTTIRRVAVGAIALAAALSSILAACGGGSSGSTSPVSGRREGPAATIQVAEPVAAAVGSPAATETTTAPVVTDEAAGQATPVSGPRPQRAPRRESDTAANQPSAPAPRTWTVQCADGRSFVLDHVPAGAEVDTLCGPVIPPTTTPPPARPKIVSMSATMNGQAWMTPEGCPDVAVVSFTVRYDTGATASGTVSLTPNSSKSAYPEPGGAVSFSYLWPLGPGGGCIKSQSYG